MTREAVAAFRLCASVSLWFNDTGGAQTRPPAVRLPPAYADTHCVPAAMRAG